jgi:HPt (histidine-containing phosphotransfer) domain-containing protein
MDGFLSKPFNTAALLAAVVRATAVPVSFDPSALAEMLELDRGAPGTMARLAAMFSAGTPALIDTIAHAAAGSDEEARRSAHSLKSSSASFGALALAALAARAEAAAREGRLSAVRELAEAMRLEFSRADGELAAHLRRVAATPQAQAAAPQ